MVQILSRETIRAAVDRVMPLSATTAVFMFGSRARGYANVDSDIDLMIDFVHIPTDHELRLIKRKLQRHLLVKVDIVQSEFTPPPFLASIRKQLIRIR